MSLSDIINRVAKKPKYQDDSGMGDLETFDPTYNRVKPDWESKRNAEEVDVPEPATPDYTLPKDFKSKGLNHRDLQSLSNDKAKDNKKAEIEKLLKDYDKASHDSKMSSIAAGLSEAGMEFGHAFGGNPVDKQFIQGIRDRADTGRRDVLKKNDLSLEKNKDFRDQSAADQRLDMNAQSMDNTGLDMEKKQDALNNEDDMINKSSEESVMARQIARDMGIDVPESADARSITNVLPFVKEKMQEKKATRHETESTKRTGIQQWGANKRASEANATGVAKTLIQAGQRESVQGLRQDEANRKIAERIIKGRRFHNMKAGEIPSADDAKQVKDMKAAWEGLQPIQDAAIQMLETNPRNFIGSDAWNKLKSSWVDMANLRNHINKNGVMNFNDWESLMQNMGDPNSLNQWLTKGGLVRLKEAKKNGEIRRIAFDNGHGYEDGDMSISEAPGIYSGGSVSRSGNTLQPTQQGLGTMLDAAGLPPIQMNQSKSPETPPIPQGAVSHGRVMERVTDPDTGITYTLYEDGFKTRGK